MKLRNGILIETSIATRVSCAANKENCDRNLLPRPPRNNSKIQMRESVFNLSLHQLRPGCASVHIYCTHLSASGWDDVELIHRSTDKNARTPPFPLGHEEQHPKHTDSQNEIEAFCEIYLRTDQRRVLPLRPPLQPRIGCATNMTSSLRPSLQHKSSVTSTRKTQQKPASLPT